MDGDINWKYSVNWRYQLEISTGNNIEWVRLLLYLGFECSVSRRREERGGHTLWVLINGKMPNEDLDAGA